MVKYINTMLPPIKISSPEFALKKARAVASAQLEYLDASYKRILNPRIYKVSITENLKSFKMLFIDSKQANRLP